ncbi:aldehyde dehydrogenase family protein [Streptomyces sp. NPDC002680]|uniref:aldehyde dehydrogenase family protein n=1 Tax=Streptomyces sp. NPDC002680 TaxID=3364659 RepID=UPI0036D173C3
MSPTSRTLQECAPEDSRVCTRRAVRAVLQPVSSTSREWGVRPSSAGAPRSGVSSAAGGRNGPAGRAWTGDIKRGTALDRRIRTGTVDINSSRMGSATPFGGCKDSGLGR